MIYSINSLNSHQVKNSSRLGLYFHFPYCSARCPYCSFTVTTATIDHQGYLKAGLIELEARINELMQLGWLPQPLHSLYVGGGTPGLWNPESLHGLIEGARTLLGFEANAEITIEVNPSEATQELMDAWARVGVNRLSLGAQSMRHEALIRLGRTHTPHDVQRAVESAKRAGIERISLDLIHGLQGESEYEALFDLEQVLELNPTHISLYQLTIEPQTQFYARTLRGESLLAPDDRLLDIYHALEKRLEEAGFTLYEVSNAALKGEESRHNLLYWTLGQYLGVGVGAHGRVDLPLHSEDQQSLRWQNIRSTKEYLKIDQTLLSSGCSSIEDERQWLSAEALDEERVLVGLRLANGLKITPSLEHRYGKHAQDLIKQGLLQYQAPTDHSPLGRWYATREGRVLLDSVSTRLILG